MTTLELSFGEKNISLVISPFLISSVIRDPFTIIKMFCNLYFIFPISNSQTVPSSFKQLNIYIGISIYIIYHRTFCKNPPLKIDVGSPALDML